MLTPAGVILITFLLLALLSLPAMAEKFVMYDGSEIEGTVTRKTDSGTISIRMSNGVSSYNLADFSDETIERCFKDYTDKVFLSKTSTETQTQQSDKATSLTPANPIDREIVRKGWPIAVLAAGVIGIIVVMMKLFQSKTF